MRGVVVLAVVGLIALIVAMLTGSTPLAVVVIALAVAGIVQLVRDWRREPAPALIPAPVVESAPSSPTLSVDEFSPDISTDPNGPSSNARADQP